MGRAAALGGAGRCSVEYGQFHGMSSTGR
jgi:hypothetical protein